MNPAQDDPTRDWTAPGVFEVAPSVYRIPLPMPNDGLTAVNIYALVQDDDVVLIDGGWNVDAARDALASAFGTLGAGLDDVSRILVTHVHRDHYTMAVRIKREHGAHISLGEHERATAEAAMNPTRLPMTEQSKILRRAGANELLEQVSAFEPDPDEWRNWDLPDHWLTPYEQIGVGTRTLDVIPTPGHTKGHMVFTDAEAKLTFAGDHVLPRITPSIGLEAVQADSPLADYLESLALVRDMPDAALLPAHGPITTSVHARVDELIAHHARRLDQSAAAIAAGAVTASDATRILTWTRRERKFDDLDLFNQILATSETAAHLTVLVSQGRLTMQEIDGVRNFTSA